MRYLEGERIMNIQEQVLEGLKKVVNGKEVTLDSNLKELGLDSLDVVDMLMDLEEKFGIEFENEEMMAFQVVSDIVSAIEKKTA